MKPDFLPENEALYKPWQGKKRTSLISAHILPRLRRTRIVFNGLKALLAAKYPPAKRVRICAAPQLMHEPSQMVATSVDLPCAIYAATCLEEFAVEDLIGILAVEWAKALCVLGCAEAPPLEWPAHIQDEHYRQLASALFEREIAVWPDGIPHARNLLSSERYKKRYPWMVPWIRDEQVDETEFELDDFGVPKMMQLELGL